MKVTLWRQDVELRRAVRSAAQHHATRSRLVLRVEHDGLVGFGEIAPQPEALNGDAGLADVIDEVRVFVAPQLTLILEREGDPPSWTRVARFAGSRPASHPAVALLEMALLDRELRDRRQSVDALWPEHFDTPSQVTVSLLDDEDWHVDPNAARVRAKVSAAPLSAIALKHLATVSVPVLLDYNCEASGDDDVIEQVRRARDVAQIVAVEQPYAVGNVVDTARLAERLDVAMSVDEGVRSARDIAQLVRYHAAEIVCVKPARVGGLANARTIIIQAQEAGLRPYLGGFFESPYARHVHRLLARNCVNEPSDLDPVDVALHDYAREVDLVDGGFGLSPSGESLAHSEVLVDFEATI